MNKTKQTIIATIEELKDKLNDMSLCIDTVLFDNIIMLDKIFNNFNTLTKINEDN